MNTYQLQRAIARYIRGTTRSTYEIELAWMRHAVMLQMQLREQHSAFDADHGLLVARIYRGHLSDIVEEAKRARGVRTDAKHRSTGVSAARKARIAAVNRAHYALYEATRAKHQQMGIERYVWVTSRDARVRPRHKELDRTIHRWDDPPMSDPRTGRRCHPGEDYGCRCTASPLQEDIIALLRQPKQVPPPPPITPAIQQPAVLHAPVLPAPDPASRPSPDTRGYSRMWARILRWLRRKK